MLLCGELEIRQDTFQAITSKQQVCYSILIFYGTLSIMLFCGKLEIKQDTFQAISSKQQVNIVPLF